MPNDAKTMTQKAQNIVERVTDTDMQDVSNRVSEIGDRRAKVWWGPVSIWRTV